MSIETAPKKWVGEAEAFDEVLVVDAELVRELMDVRSVGDPDAKPLLVLYYMRGRLRTWPKVSASRKKLKLYVGIGNMMVDFGDFKIKCRLWDRQGRIRSIDGIAGATMTAEELWALSGGDV